MKYFFLSTCKYISHGVYIALDRGRGLYRIEVQLTLKLVMKERFFQYSKVIGLDACKSCSNKITLCQPDRTPGPSSFYADQRIEMRDFACQSSLFSGIHHRADVLVGAGRFLRDAAC